MPESAELVRFAADRVRRLLQKFSLQSRKTLRARHDTEVHYLRVAIRRFSQALEVFKAWFQTSQVQAIRRQLKSIASAAGDVRNCDITLELLAKSGSTGAARWSTRIHDRRKAAERRLAATLRRWVAQKRGAKWRPELAAMEAPEAVRSLSWEDLAHRELPVVARAFFQSGNRAADSRSGKELHKLRIEAKRFRYTFELFQDAHGADSEARIEQLRKLQTLLGNINDLRTARKLFEEIGAGDKLTDPLRKKQRKRTREFQSLWETEFSRTEAREWMQFLRGVQRKSAGRSGAAAGRTALTA